MNTRSLSFLICFSLFSLEASANIFGNVKDFLGLSPKSRISVPWTCPSGPNATNVQVTYNENGRISFRPNVFKAFSGGQNMAACRDTFVAEAEKKINDFKAKNCPDDRQPLCWISNPTGALGFKLYQTNLFVESSPRNGTTPDLDQHAENCPEPKVDEKIADLLAVVNEIQKAPDCGEMPPGSSRLSNTNKQGPSYSKMVEGEYLLNRRPDGNYEALVNVVFNNVSGKNGPDWMRSRVESCLSISAPYLKGPNNELLSVKLASEKDLDNLPSKSRPKPFVINVYDKTARTFATMFPEDADCSVLTHEILHEFGLCDEYHETQITGYNCRPNTMATNIMNEHYKAYSLTVPKQLTCPCDDVCQKIMKSDPRASEFFLAPETAELLPAAFIGVGAANCVQKYVADPKGYNENVRPFEIQETLTQLTLNRRMVNTSGQISGYMQITCPCDDTQATCRTVKKQLKMVIANNPRRSICPPYPVAPLQNLT
jgi:hypothetical protein